MGFSPPPPNTSAHHHDPRKVRESRWKEHDAYQKVLDRLLRDLRVEKT
jgi:hypothetical protein